MSTRRRWPLWLAALVFAALAVGIAERLWRDGHIDNANAEVAAVLAPALLAAVFAMLASRTLDDVGRQVVATVKAWKGGAS